MEENQYEWATVESVETFACRQDNESKGKCGWDAARRAMIAIGVLNRESTIKDYRNWLLEFVKGCTSDMLVWRGDEWKGHHTLKELREKLERTFDEKGRGSWKLPNWYAVDDFMLACAYFQVAIFVYHDWKNRHGQPENVPTWVEHSPEGFT